MGARNGHKIDDYTKEKAEMGFQANEIHCGTTSKGAFKRYLQEINKCLWEANGCQIEKYLGSGRKKLVFAIVKTRHDLVCHLDDVEKQQTYSSEPRRYVLKMTFTPALRKEHKEEIDFCN